MNKRELVVGILLLPLVLPIAGPAWVVGWTSGLLYRAARIVSEAFVDGLSRWTDER